jgi:hypothetical protein
VRLRCTITGHIVLECITTNAIRFPFSPAAACRSFSLINWKGRVAIIAPNFPELYRELKVFEIKVKCSLSYFLKAFGIIVPINYSDSRPRLSNAIYFIVSKAGCN